MSPSQDERLSGDLPVSPTPYEETRPAVSHEVVATYVADAARSVPGILDLHTSAWKGLSSRVRETHTGGVFIRESSPGTVDVEVHACVAWGVVIPELASEVEGAVRNRVTGLLNLELGNVTLFVDEIAGPTGGGHSLEG
jgi:uncharacterized alkaline shock family protein YloU